MSVNDPPAPSALADAAPALRGAAELELVDLREHPDERLLAVIHDGLYTRSFPRPEERESLESLRDALWGEAAKEPARSHFVVARSATAPDGVAGFVACEYYPRSRCGLISYIAVDSGMRGLGLGRTLLERAIAILRADAQPNGALEAVLAEIHDPSKVKETDDVIPPLDRIRIMDRLGAKRLPIAYVQPELAPGHGRGRGKTLMLIAFPTGDTELETLPSAVVRDFLEELYEVLGVDRHDEDVDFIRSLVGLREETLELVPLVPVEKPLLSEIAEYGIGIHFPVRNPRSRTADSDTVMRSFEDDILAYAYRESPPFRTRAVPVPDEWARISVEFAGEITYLSEGRRVTFLAEGKHVPLQCADGPQGRTRRFLLRASRTDFETSELSILHLVFGPDPGSEDSTLNEWDLIKLMKLWNEGEGLTADGTDAVGKRFVCFRAGGREVTLPALAAAVFSEQVEPDAPRVGTVQILHEVCRDGLCADIVKVRDHQSAEAMRPEVVAVGGLIQGLLDFGEIDADELADVFKDLYLEEELASSIHKGTLLVVSASDRAFSAEHVRLAIGLSPYLLVPHAVLLHNEWWLRDAVQRLDKAQEPGRRSLTRRPRLKNLEEARSEVAQTVSRRLIPNVFHYEDERRLYAVGRLSRALHKRQQSVQSRLAALSEQIKARHEKVRRAVALSLPVFALLFTWSDALGKHDPVLVALVLVPTTILTLGGLALIFWRD
jgi:GNAT superfamily N-acetyltransferase